MARSSATSALVLASLVVAAFSPAAAQGDVGAGPLPAPIGAPAITAVGTGSGAVVPTSSAAATAAGPAASTVAPDNRTVGSQTVVPPGGCMVVSITSGADLCLENSSFQVNNVSIAIPADYRAEGVAGSNAFFNLSNYNANNAACAAAKPTVTPIYEKTGCILADAAASVIGDASDIVNSFVCASSGVDTTNYAHAFGSSPAEVKLCATAIKDAQSSIAAGTGTATSGDPCSAARATFIISNPCPMQNATVNTTARFFLAPDTLAPAPAPSALLAPATAPGSAATPGDVLSPSDAPVTAPAPAPGAITAADLAPPTAAPAPAPQSAGRGAVASALAAAAAIAALAVLT